MEKLDQRTARRLILTVSVSFFIYALACFSPISWSPDGSQIALMRAGDKTSEIWVIGANGKSKRRIAANEEALLSPPSWSPDGKQITYMLYPRKKKGTRADLILFDVKSSKAKKLTSVPVSMSDDGETGLLFYKCLWSPDGKRILFRSMMDDKCQLWLFNKEKDERKQVGDPQGSLLGAAWSPDGKQIAYMLISEKDGDTHELCVSPSEKPDEVQLLAKNIKHPQEGPLFYYIAWLSDGERIAYTAKTEGREAVVCTFNVKTKQTAKLDYISDPEGFPAWSPDGKKLAYASDDGMVVMNADGTGKNIITKFPGTSFQPAWSPDGRQLAFRTSSSKGEYGELSVLRLWKEGDAEPRWLPADDHDQLAIGHYYRDAADKADEADAALKKGGQRAIEELERFVEQYPDSLLAEKAIDAIAKTEDELAKLEKESCLAWQSVDVCGSAGVCCSV